MVFDSEALAELAAASPTRAALWSRFIAAAVVKRMAEIGVYRGAFAADMLHACPGIERYYLIDPWRHLEDWNKPANSSNDVFEGFLAETLERTAFAADRRIVLRGKTTEVVDRIADGALDFCYIDGDHTLKGITIDLTRLYPKVRSGGWIGGDDFTRSVWQHRTSYEPTLVFPFAVYFAEAMGARIYALPHAQFLIEKDAPDGFAFVDLTGRYDDVSLRSQFHPDYLLRLRLAEAIPFARRALGVPQGRQS
jgi:predicted O-methyltransferase YrrM